MRRVGRPWRVLLLIVAWGGLAPADDTRPAPLARYFPRRDLVAYVEFDGIDAHAGAWKKTAIGKILGETTTGSMLKSVAVQCIDGLMPAGHFPEGMKVGDRAVGLVEHLARSGLAFGINRAAGEPNARPRCVGLVLRGLGRTHLVEDIRVALPTAETVDKPGGRKVSIIGEKQGPCVAWWVEKDDLAFALLRAEHADAMIAALDGKEPDAVEHPTRKELLTSVGGFEPVGLAFLDTLGLPEMPDEAAMFGLDGIKRLDIRWGYRGEALVSVSRILAPSPRRGVLAMFDQPTFGARSLPPLPDGVGDFTVVSLDMVKVFDQMASLLKLADPKGPDLFARVSEQFRAATGRRLREDVLAEVGPRLAFADVPTRVVVSSDKLGGFARGLARVPRTSLLIELTDRGRFLKDLDALATWVNVRFPLPKDPKARVDRPAPALVRRLKNVKDGYEVALSPTYWPLPAGYRPSIVVGEKFAAIGTTPDVARRALRADGQPGASTNRLIDRLPDDLMVLSVADTPNSAIPDILSNVPSMIQWWGFVIQGAEFSNNNGVARVAVPVPEILVPPTPPTIVPEAGATPSAILVPVQPRDIPVPVQPPVPPEIATGIGALRAKIPGLAFRLRLDPDEIPAADEIRRYLFPATYMMSADASGFRIETRESFPGWDPISLAPAAVSAALPAFQEWRIEKEKARLAANLRQVGLAMQAYQLQKGHFPPASILDKEGRPLLSWRVELLPFLGLRSLYDEFRHDEAWDGPRNKALIERMPAAFAHPDAPAGPGLTFYRGLIGRSAFFDPAETEGVIPASVTDGPAHTLAIVEAREAVPWTKPGTEIPGEVNPMLPLLGGHTRGGFQAMMVDGSVRFVRETIGMDVLRALITRDNGEGIPAGSF